VEGRATPVRLLFGLRGELVDRRFTTFLLFGGLAALANLTVGRALYDGPAGASWPDGRWWAKRLPVLTGRTTFIRTRSTSATQTGSVPEEATVGLVGWLCPRSP
jgi:hypothetical protein